MGETNRVYKRKKYSVPFTYTAEEYPPVASASQPLPLYGDGMFIEKKYNGIVKNSSLGGFCFATDKSILPGTEINAKTAVPMTMQVENLDSTECRAMVKWCSSTDSDNLYNIGVERIRECLLPIMNFNKSGFGSIKSF